MARMTLEEYYAKVGSRFTQKDAETIGPELSRLAATGAMVPENVVKEAEAASSPLHPYFEWDNERCGYLWRCKQARDMINSIEVVVISQGEKRKVPAFCHVEITPVERTTAGLDASKQSPYLTVERVLSEEDKLSQKIEEARRMLSHWRERYALWMACSREFQEQFQPVFDAIDEMNRRAEEPAAV